MAGWRGRNHSYEEWKEREDAKEREEMPSADDLTRESEREMSVRFRIISIEVVKDGQKITFTEAFVHFGPRWTRPGRANSSKTQPALSPIANWQGVWGRTLVCVGARVGGGIRGISALSVVAGERYVETHDGIGGVEAHEDQCVQGVEGEIKQ